MKYRKVMFFQKKFHPHFGICYIGVLILFISFLAISVLVFVGRTKAADSRQIYKYYTSIEVKNGDTLWSIASEYRTEEYCSLQEYVSEIRKLNGLTGDKIRSGQFLVVPYYSDILK